MKRRKVSQFYLSKPRNVGAIEAPRHTAQQATHLKQHQTTASRTPVQGQGCERRLC